jgi:outer membrane receptor protein involved in Fe transport
VSAHKREESVLDIPASVQALTADDLKNIQAKNMADYTRFIPSVNIVDSGAGSIDVVFRGTTVAAGYIGASSSSLYLDETSLTTLGSQPSVRMVDIARVEALSGPQGTLYGSDSQAGTLRIISNQPALNTQEVILDVSAKDSSEGEMSYDGSLVVNIPVIEDKVAVRLVGFHAKDGGFIDNVFGNTIDTDRISGAPSGWGELDNADVVEDDINDYVATGYRAAVSWQINEDWETTLSYLSQKTESGSYNAYNPYVGDLEIIKYNEEHYDMDYEVAGLVFKGDLGFAQFVSSTSYFDNEEDFTQDITSYQKSFGSYYCRDNGAGPGPYYFNAPGGGVTYNGHYCVGATLDGDAFIAFDEDITSDRFSQEFRLSAEGDTFDWLVGAYYEESSYSYTEWFGYPTKHPGVARNAERGGLYEDSVSFAYHNTFNPGTGDLAGSRAPFNATNTTDLEQFAVFGEVEWHVTDKLDITLGARWFDRETQQFYTESQPEGFVGVKGERIPPYDETTSESEISPKLSISYSFDDDQMIYGLYSVGYKPGGVNRLRGEPQLQRDYDPDKLNNYEIGYKGTLMDGSMQLTLTGFYMDWQDFQFELLDPSFTLCPELGLDGPQVAGVCGQPYQAGIVNAGDAHIMGAYFELDWALSNNFTLGFNGEWLEAESDTDVVIGDTDFGGSFIPKGSDLPSTPEWTAAAWAEYTFPLEMIDADAYIRLQWSYSGARLNSFTPEPIADDTFYPQWEDDAYDIGDLSVGIAGDTWETILFVSNITDERAIYGHGYGGYSQAISSQGVDHIDEVYVNRPREVGIRFIKRWGG